MPRSNQPTQAQEPEVVEGTDVEQYTDPVEKTALAMQERPKDLATSSTMLAVRDWYFDTFPADLEDSEAIQEQIVANILAMGADDVLTVAESLDSAGKLAHKPITFVGVRSVLPSSKKAGAFYIIADIVRDGNEGEVEQVAFGSPTMLAQIAVLYRADRFPLRCKVVPIASGGREGRNPPLYLRPINY